MIKLTKTQLQELFDSSKTWEEIATSWNENSNVEITPKMVQECFKANGFNLRSRARTKAPWFTMIDDLSVINENQASVNNEEITQYS